MPRLLVYTPTYEDRLQQETVASIEALRFQGKLDWVLSEDNPYPGRDMRNVVHQFRKGRELALTGEYDGMLMVEHDIIVPPDAAQRLWDTDAGVVYGSYMLRHLMYSINLFQYVGNRNIGMSLSIYPRELQYARQRGWIEVSGAGFGCLLVRREVLSIIPFRDVGNAPDLPFAKDCVTRGIQQIGRTDVECGHIDLDHSGRTLWPLERGGLLMGVVARVIAQQDVNVNDEGREIAMKRGRYYSISVALADDLQRAGYARITNEADIVAAEMAQPEGAAGEEREQPDMGERELAVDPKARGRSTRKAVTK